MGQRLLVGAALAVTLAVTAALALDRIFPPNLTRYLDRSTEVVDANGRLLRAFTANDGAWRLKTTVDDVDPLYLALLKTYEDSRFDYHVGVDPMAVVRSAALDIAPVFVPLAAAGLVLVMIGAIVVHVRRQEPFIPQVLLLVLAAVVVWGRFGPYSF